MTQDPTNLLASCHVCDAGSGQQCITRDGEIAERSHFGRPANSAIADMDPTFPRPLTPDQKRERWNRLILGSEASMRISITPPPPDPTPTDGGVADFDIVIGQIEADANPRPRSLKVHYRHARLANTDEHPTRWADAQRAPRIHAACGGYFPPERVTDQGERVDCRRCLPFVPPSHDTLAAMVAQLDDWRPRHG